MRSLPWLTVTYDIAFVDIGLPGFNGYDVARQIRAMRGSTIVLVALTGYGQPADRAEVGRPPGSIIIW